MATFKELKAEVNRLKKSAKNWEISFSTILSKHTDLIREYDELETEYAFLIETNNSKRYEINKLKHEIEQLKAEVAKHGKADVVVLKATNFKLRKENETLKATNDNLEKTNASLSARLLELQLGNLWRMDTATMLQRWREYKEAEYAKEIASLKAEVEKLKEENRMLSRLPNEHLNLLEIDGVEETQSAYSLSRGNVELRYSKAGGLLQVRLENDGILFKNITNNDAYTMFKYSHAL